MFADSEISLNDIKFMCLKTYNSKNISNFLETHIINEKSKNGEYYNIIGLFYNFSKAHKDDVQAVNYYKIAINFKNINACNNLETYYKNNNTNNNKNNKLIKLYNIGLKMNYINFIRKLIEYYYNRQEYNEMKKIFISRYNYFFTRFYLFVNHYGSLKQFADICSFMFLYYFNIKKKYTKSLYYLNLGYKIDKNNKYILYNFGCYYLEFKKNNELAKSYFIKSVNAGYKESLKKLELIM